MDIEKIEKINTDSSMRIEEKQNRITPGPQKKNRHNKEFGKVLEKTEKDVQEDKKEQKTDENKAKYIDGKRVI
jgi:flagellar hook-basal body complex protein FliE